MAAASDDAATLRLWTRKAISPRGDDPPVTPRMGGQPPMPPGVRSHKPRADPIRGTAPR